MGKKILLSLLLLSIGIAYAEEPAVLPSQEANDNRAVVAVQKQPSNKEQKQGVSRNWFCIVIQCNGKVYNSPVQDK